MLAAYTTLKIGGAARYFGAVTTAAELVEGLAFAERLGLPVFVLGGGSNLVIADEGFEGVVLRVALTPKITQTDDGDYVRLDVSAGTDWDALVRYACERGLCGMECMAGIPGLTGGTPVQNVGAYGQEVAQTIEQVWAYDTWSHDTWAHDTGPHDTGPHDTGPHDTGPHSTGPQNTGARGPVCLSAEECGFSYRHSVFNSTLKGRYIVTAVRFKLDRRTQPNLAYADLAGLHGTGASAMDVYTAVRAIRAAKGMLVDPERLGADARSAGSFFKNPVVTEKAAKGVAEGLGISLAEMPHWPAAAGSVKLSAAWLIDQAGFKKGFALGRVGISSRHTLALINRTGDATCEELLRLKDLIVMTVEDRFRVGLEQEPVFLGSQVSGG